MLEFFCVFIYPLVLPILALSTLTLAAASSGFRLRQASRSGAMVSCVLTGLMGPTIESSGVGTVLVPWWGPTELGRQYYLWQFALACEVYVIGLVLAASLLKWFTGGASDRAPGAKARSSAGSRGR